jgi:mRNA-degrading endonuclease RelE of RelBE toxin-antitoxin system
MVHYDMELSPAAYRDLKSLPRQVRKDMAMVHLPIIKANPYEAGKPLVGALRKERSYHFGRKPEYRIIYFIEGKVVRG